jgi:Uma2 family endonuclease
MTAIEALNTPQVARLTSRDFILLAESGAFNKYAKAELIEGEIFVVNAQFRRHATFRRKLMRRFEDELAGRADGLGVTDECNVELSDQTMPQPDITITFEPEGDGPIPFASIRMIVEIADTTANYDLGRKRELYARHGVPEYWVIDADKSRVVQFWALNDGDYAERREIALGERVEAATIPGLAVNTADL